MSPTPIERGKREEWVVEKSWAKSLAQISSGGGLSLREKKLKNLLQKKQRKVHIRNCHYIIQFFYYKLF
jgi:hypothetical protein